MQSTFYKIEAFSRLISQKTVVIVNIPRFLLTLFFSELFWENIKNHNYVINIV